MEGFLAANPYFSAGAGILGLTAIGGLAVKGLGHAAYLARRRLLVSLEIPIKDASYPWFLEWMSKQGKQQSELQKGALQRLLGTKNVHQLSVETQLVKHDNGSVSSSFSLVPGQGKHFFIYRGAWFQVERSRAKNMMNIATGIPWETINVTTLSRDRHLFLEMLQEAKVAAMAKEEGKTVVYTSFGPEWRPFGQPRRKRPLSSVVLDGNTSSSILADVRQFLGSSGWYYDRGIPYRRGYLLYGPPGSGKSSFIQSLAGELDYSICIMNLAELGMTDDRFAHLLNNLPPRSIILLEDVDAAFSARTSLESKTKGYQSMLTLSGLLNGLDGVVAAEERIIFMTTNHLERLDPALTRPGRVDFKVLLDNLTKTQALELFLRFYPEQHGLGTLFVEKMQELELIGRLSPASLQGHFVMYRDSAEDALAHLSSIGVFTAKKD
ncbi:hypothetical protein HDU91_004504 [Kappamyces sp. JEL0680]|nr:hypothetical protein HDU91_004504 [Kappamyces sp. JEL0680]